MITTFDTVRLVLFCGGIILVYWLAFRWSMDRFRRYQPVSLFGGIFHSTSVGTLLLTLAVAGVLCMAYGFLIEPNRLTVRTHRIETRKIPTG
jgi:hypothetical protein